MKNTILLLSITLTIIACSSKSEREVVLFNDINFKLIDREKVIHIDSKEKDIFNSYLDKTSVQIPLFKCIKSDNYLIFLGIPINTSIKQLAGYNLKNIKKQLLYETDSINYFYKTYLTENYKIAIFAKNFDDNLIYLLIISDSDNLSDSLFNRISLSNRFNK